MGQRGRKSIEWTKELDEKLLNGLASGKKATGLEVSLKMSYDVIDRRIKEMGFYGLLDARRVLRG